MVMNTMLDVNPVESDTSLQSFIEPLTEKMVSGKPTSRHYQTTLATSFRLSGIGLHTGESIAIQVEPANAGGINFIRSDLSKSQPVLPARYDLVSYTDLCTQLENDSGVTVATIEHLMAALHGLGIDHASVYVNGGEMPILDGSSKPFIEAIQHVGLSILPLPKQALRIEQTVEVVRNDAFARFKPAEDLTKDTLTIDLTIDYPAAAIGRQHFKMEVTPERFIDEIAEARTFCLKQDIEAMLARNLIRGGSLDNAVVVEDDKIINEEGLRFTDEFVRHKLLDCIGDMALAGAPLIGTLEAACTGHGLNNQLLRKAFATEGALRPIQLA